jgi:hypothetical protein
MTDSIYAGVLFTKGEPFFVAGREASLASVYLERIESRRVICRVKDPDNMSPTVRDERRLFGRG